MVSVTVVPGASMKEGQGPRRVGRRRTWFSYWRLREQLVVASASPRSERTLSQRDASAVRLRASNESLIDNLCTFGACADWPPGGHSSWRLPPKPCFIGDGTLAGGDERSPRILGGDVLTRTRWEGQLLKHGCETGRDRGGAGALPPPPHQRQQRVWSRWHRGAQPRLLTAR